MHCNASQVFTHQLAFPGVQSAADFETEQARRFADRCGATDRSRRTVEGCKETITRSIDFASLEVPQHVSNSCAERRKHFTPWTVTHRDGPFGGSDDVRKENRGQ